MKHTLWFLLLIIALPVQAQFSIDKKRQLMREGDIIYKQQVEYKSPGYSGENIVWDFSKLKPVDENYKLSYHSLNDSTFTGIEHRTIYRYILKGDSLFISGYENPLTMMQTFNPELLLIFPFSYKMKIGKTFVGTGRYSERMQMDVSGNSLTTADAYGILILPNKDTLDNVLRIHSVKSANTQLRNIQQTAVAAAIAAYSRSDWQIDSSQVQIEDIYRWYAEGYRYPVFETITHSYLKNGKTIQLFNTSFFYPPEEQKYLNEDIENMAIREQRKLEEDKNRWNKYKMNGLLYDSDSDIINYEIRNNPEGQIDVDYCLSEEATVSMTLTDVQGGLMICIPEKTYSSGQYKENIDCSGLQTGKYILCLTVNKKNYSNKIIIYKN